MGTLTNAHQTKETLLPSYISIRRNIEANANGSILHISMCIIKSTTIVQIDAIHSRAAKMKSENVARSSSFLCFIYKWQYITLACAFNTKLSRRVGQKVNIDDIKTLKLYTGRGY
jgi:hypothetical protein